MYRFAGALVAFLAAGVAASAAPVEWRQEPALGAPRSEVGAAVAGGSIYVVGGFNPDGAGSRRVDAYSPQTRSWGRVADLPVVAHHPAATGYRGRLYVAGGYAANGQPLSQAFVLQGRAWRALPRMPEPRAAAGAAFLNGQLYVVGGVVRPSGHPPAAPALRYDLRRRPLSRVPGPTPREHLGVTALRGRLYAVAGRKLGFDTNLATFESFAPGARRWRALAPVPGTRGGTGAAGTGRSVVSIGGERFEGTIETVFAYDVFTRRWR